VNRILEVMRGMAAENWVFKAVAFILTLSLFIWVRDDRQASVVAFAPLRIVIPDGMELVSPPLDRVRLTVRGRWSEVNSFDPTSVDPIPVEATREAEQLIPITASMVRLPNGLRPTSIQPDVVKVRLEEEDRKTVRVKLRIVGEPRDNYRLGEIQIDPPQVGISGPKSAIADVDFISTEPIDVTGQSQTIRRQLQLRPENPMVSYELKEPLSVVIPIETVEVQRTLQNISVIIVNSPRPADVTPQTVSATVRGPKVAVDQLDPGSIQARVDMADTEAKPPGNFERQPVIKPLPSDVNLVDYFPKDVIVTTRPVQPSTP